MTNPWDDATRAGFEDLIEFRSTVISSKWTEPKNPNPEFAPTKQLELVHQIEFVSDPPDGVIPESYITWFSTGSKSDFEITDDGDTLWSPSAAAANERISFVKSSKYGKLIDRSIEQQSPVIQRGWPTDARIWLGLRADWRQEVTTYGGRLKDSTVTLPTQVLGIGGVAVPGAPIAAAPAVNNGAVAPSAPAPAMAAPPAPPVAQAPALGLPAPPMAFAPPPVPVAPSAPSWTVSAQVVASLKEAGWLDYVAGVLNNGLWGDVVKAIRANDNCMGNSILMTAIENNGLLAYMQAQGFFEVDAGNIIHQKLAV